MQSDSSAAIKEGLYETTPVAKAAALTAQLTSLTIADPAGTPDYAIQAITSSTPFGFVNAAECITLLYVVKNLQVRVAEMEVILENLGAVTAN